MILGVLLAMLVKGTLLLERANPAAQQRPDPARTFAATKSAKCEFTVLAVGNWKDGIAQAEVKPAKMSFGFEEVDTDGGTARVVGIPTFGPSDIVVRISGESLHFMQSFREGPLYLTTVIGQSAGNGRWLAVHTRHEFTEVSLPGYTSKPEQYYGTCTVQP